MKTPAPPVQAGEGGVRGRRLRTRKRGESPFAPGCADIPPARGPPRPPDRPPEGATCGAPGFQSRTASLPPRAPARPPETPPPGFLSVQAYRRHGRPAPPGRSRPGTEAARHLRTGSAHLPRLRRSAHEDREPQAEAPCGRDAATDLLPRMRSQGSAPPATARRARRRESRRDNPGGAADARIRGLSPAVSSMQRGLFLVVRTQRRSALSASRTTPMISSAVRVRRFPFLV